MHFLPGELEFVQGYWWSMLESCISPWLGLVIGRHCRRCLCRPWFDDDCCAFALNDDVSEGDF